MQLDKLYKGSHLEHELHRQSFFLNKIHQPGQEVAFEIAKILPG
jgi:hypothetical protein